jgi:hypothetical protein
MQPHELELHKTQEIFIGDSKDMIHLQQIEIQAKNHTRKTTKTMSQTTCIKNHKNLQKHKLVFWNLKSPKVI